MALGETWEHNGVTIYSEGAWGTVESGPDGDEWSLELDSGMYWYGSAGPLTKFYDTLEELADGFLAELTTPGGPGYCVLETAYGHGGPTRYCRNRVYPGSTWCKAHLDEWGYLP